jgi:hypothetical protein
MQPLYTAVAHATGDGRNRRARPHEGMRILAGWPRSRRRGSSSE